MFVFIFIAVLLSFWFVISISFKFLEFWKQNIIIFTIIPFVLGVFQFVNMPMKTKAYLLKETGKEVVQVWDYLTHKKNSESYAKK